MTLGPVQFKLPALETPLLKAGVEFNETPVKSDSAGGSFAKVLGDALGDLKGAHNQMNTAMEKFSAGEEIDVGSVMLSIEQTQIATELAIQVRNRLVEGFNQLIRMQI